jgi:hypothetical protein
MQRTGRKMLDIKTEVINRCEKAGIGVVLVPLVAKGYNLHEVGSIIDFAAGRVPAVRGVHFQPVFHSGRSPSDMADKITILKLLQEIEKQTNGQIKVSNFTPALMPHAHCGATCLTLIDNGGYLPLTNVSMGAVKSASDVASKTKKSIMGRWKGLENDSTPDSGSSCGDLMIKSSCCEKPLSSITVKGSCCEKPLSDITVKGSCCEKPLIDILPKDSGSGKDESGGWADFIEMSKNNYLTISMMAFQDAWSYEQDRVENCCIHVVTRDGRFVPFCNYNMTDCNGNFLYRNAI